MRHFPPINSNLDRLEFKVGFRVVGSTQSYYSNLDRLEFKGKNIWHQEAWQLIRIQTDWNLKIVTSESEDGIKPFEFRQTGI